MFNIFNNIGLGSVTSSISKVVGGAALIGYGAMCAASVVADAGACVAASALPLYAASGVCGIIDIAATSLPVLLAPIVAGAACAVAGAYYAVDGLYTMYDTGVSSSALGEVIGGAALIGAAACGAVTCLSSAAITAAAYTACFAVSSPIVPVVVGIACVGVGAYYAAEGLHSLYDELDVTHMLGFDSDA